MAHSERFITAANVELLEARLASGELDEAATGMVQKLLACYRRRLGELTIVESYSAREARQNIVPPDR